MGIKVCLILGSRSDYSNLQTQNLPKPDENKQRGAGLLGWPEQFSWVTLVEYQWNRPEYIEKQIGSYRIRRVPEAGLINLNKVCASNFM